MSTVKHGFAVLGLDGLPYWMLPRLAEEGIAPTVFNQANVERARKLTCIPPITPSSWPSIMSGVNPGKHGIYSFFLFDRVKREKRLQTALDLEHPRIHEMLSYNGARSLVVNPIPGYPIIRVSKATIVSATFFLPRQDSHPRGLIEKYFPDMWPEKAEEDYYVKLMDSIVALLEDHLKDPPSLAWVNLNVPDALMHKDPGVLEDPSRIRKAWDRVEALARILKDAYGNLAVVSDHGFRSYHTRVSVNDILYKHGLAVPGKELGQTLQEAKAGAQGVEAVKLRLPAWIYKLVSRLGLEPQARRAYARLSSLYARVTGKRLILQAGRPVDYKKSRALLPFGGAYGVYVLDADPDEVYNILSNYKGLIVWKREQVYNGPQARKAPDIVVVGDHENGYVLGNEKIMNKVYIEGKTVNHDLWGTLILDLEDAHLEWEKLPAEIPNHAVANLIMCMMGQPLSAMADSLDIIEKACGKPRLRDYTGRFLLSKKLTARRHKATS